MNVIFLKICTDINKYLPIESQGFATEDPWILIIFVPSSRNFQ